jgi:2-phospho-L-lactate guanylyltransferase
MRVIVPFDPSDPNTRLSSLLSPAERREFAAAMLRDVLVAVRDAGGQPTVLSTTPFDEVSTTHDEASTTHDEASTTHDEASTTHDEASTTHDEASTSSGEAGDPSDVAVTVDDRSLSVAVNDALADDLPAAVVMADLALATPAALSALFGTEGDVVIAPGRGGGTNALVVRHPDFAVDYHGVSFTDHVDAAEAVGAAVSTVDSFRLAVDVDEPADVLDLLVHGDGAAAAWLRDAGFRVAVEDGDQTVVRED